jgi:hypothetical protein
MSIYHASGSVALSEYCYVIIDCKSFFNVTKVE